MSDSRTSAVAAVINPVRSSTVGLVQTVNTSVAQAGAWAVDTAQQFASAVGVLMGPAVFCGYAFAFWSLASNLGWTETFPYGSGALSNWLIWTGIAILLHMAMLVLRRHTRPDVE